MAGCLAALVEILRFTGAWARSCASRVPPHAVTVAVPSALPVCGRLLAFALPARFHEVDRGLAHQGFHVCLVI